MTLTDYICQEKKGKEDLPAFEIELMQHLYNNLKTYKMVRKNDCSNQKLYRLLYGHFKRQTSEITYEKENLKKETESQNKVIKTNDIKTEIEKKCTKIANVDYVLNARKRSIT